VHLCMYSKLAWRTQACIGMYSIVHAWYWGVVHSWHRSVVHAQYQSDVHTCTYVSLASRMCACTVCHHHACVVFYYCAFHGHGHGHGHGIFILATHAEGI
jgi:hypothetical protein